MSTANETIQIDQCYQQAMNQYISNKGKLNLLLIGQDEYKNGNYKNMAFCKQTFQEFNKHSGREGNSGYTLFKSLLDIDDFMTGKCSSPYEAAMYLVQNFGIAVLNSNHSDIDFFIQASETILPLGLVAKETLEKKIVTINGMIKVITHPSSMARINKNEDWIKDWGDGGEVSNLVEKAKKTK